MVDRLNFKGLSNTHIGGIMNEKNNFITGIDRFKRVA